MAHLLVHKVNPADGTDVCDSAVGVYAVRLFMNGQWETVLVDDNFPVVPDDTSGLVVPASQGETRGAAAAHSKVCPAPPSKEFFPMTDLSL